MSNLSPLAKLCYQNSFNKGFWDDGPDRNKGEMIALMHSELSKLLEAVREEDMLMSEKIDGFTLEEEEIADLLIRALDYAYGWNLDIDGAVKAKMFYNGLRPERHGKLF